MWRKRLYLIAGLIAAVMLSSTLVLSVIGLSTSKRPTPLGAFEIPAFVALVDCNAHFSNEILRIKNKLPAHNREADLALLHRNYRRLHRLLRQVGRRDGIAPADQTAHLRQRVKQLNAQPGTNGSAGRDARCRAMANMPIARSRHSQRIVGE